MHATIFPQLFPKAPVFLAPLAGVSDHPFRRICSSLGADLTYVEMLSATALVHQSPRTWQMLARHESEACLGVQITARSAEEMGEAVALLATQDFTTVDINMGCPVRKVVGAGCGSAILKDPDRVFHTTRNAVLASSKPVSVKIRLGWDHQSINFLEVGRAAQEGGASWLTLHGRTRSDTYQDAVHLDKIARLKQGLTIPVIGNGNLFTGADAQLMRDITGVDGLMVSRGALGNPWIFAEIKAGAGPLAVSLEEWLGVVSTHMRWQEEAYGPAGVGAVCMRKHLLWYVKGWPDARRIREQMATIDSFAQIHRLLENYANDLAQRGVQFREAFRSQLPHPEQAERPDGWDPKYDMDRGLDRGVGEDSLIAVT